MAWTLYYNSYYHTWQAFNGSEKVAEWELRRSECDEARRRWFALMEPGDEYLDSSK